MSHQIFADIAAIFAAQVPPEIGLDYSEESIKQVDRLLSVLLSEPDRQHDAQSLVLSVGAYLGEATIRSLGGEWRLDEADIHDSSVVVGGCELWPFRRVRQRLHYGAERPLYAWYEMAKSGATEEIQKLLQGQEQATMIRPTGRDPLVIQVTKNRRDQNGAAES